MLGENIRKIRKAQNISINNLAKKAGISLGYLSDLENNKFTNPTLDKIKLIANALGTTVDELFTTTATKKDIDDWDSKLDIQQLAKESTVYDSINVNKSNITNIPILGTVRAGEPILAQENITGYNPVLKSILCTEKNYFYLRVQGDSMNQEFNEGDLLLIEQTDYIENGDIAVVLIDGQDATVKKVIKNENMITLIPMSTNPKYVPHMYDVIKDEIKIIGKVIQATKIY